MYFFIAFCFIQLLHFICYGLEPHITVHQKFANRVGHGSKNLVSLKVSPIVGVFGLEYGKPALCMTLH